MKKIKGIGYALDAFSKVVNQTDRSLEYHIVGSGSRRDFLEAKAEKLGIRDAITFHGHKHRDEINRFLSEAHIFLLPSLSEGLPSVLIEAQWSGIPIVATNVGGVSETVDQGAAELVPPRDPEALSKAIRDILEIPESWPRMGLAGRSYVGRNFAMDPLNDDLVKIFEELMGD